MKSNKRNSAMRVVNKTSKKKNKKSIDQMRLIYNDYLNFVINHPNTKHKEVIKEKWDDCMERWTNFCDRTPTDNTGYKPKPEDFNEFIRFTMDKKRGPIKKENKEMKPTIRQKIILFIWKCVVPSMKEHFKEQRKAGKNWQEAFKAAANVKMWYHGIFTNYNKKGNATTKN